LSAARPLEPWRWLGVPMAQVIVATILFGIPLHAFGLQLPEPVFPLTLAFAWAVIRPSILAPFGVLILGLFLDIYWGGPLGLWALCLLIAYGVALAGRSMMAGQNRAILWAWYSLTCATALVAGYLFVMLDSRSSPGIVPLIWQFVATIVLYPFPQRLVDLFEDADVRFR
jgi:rod shape-determining protein MreD